MTVKSKTLLEQSNINQNGVFKMATFRIHYTYKSVKSSSDISEESPAKARQRFLRKFAEDKIKPIVSKVKIVKGA